MKKVLVTGSGGQLAESISMLQNETHEVVFHFTGIADLDLTDKEKTKVFFRDNTFDYIINCAAYTAVDLAEKNTADAYAVNADVPAMLGDVAVQYNCGLVHVSTDYVFDGLSPVPYNETSPVNPLSVYGKSKLEGENMLKDNPNTLIIRTSWLYSEFGNNFMKTMLKLGKEKKQAGVIFDQTGCPTYAADLAEAIIRIIKASDKRHFPTGICHFSNDGVASWYDFAWEIMELSGLPCKVRPITTEEYPLPAKRPRYSVLNTAKIRTELGVQTVYWKTSLKKALAGMAKF